jgi:hypothetical protein
MKVNLDKRIKAKFSSCSGSLTQRSGQQDIKRRISNLTKAETRKRRYECESNGELLGKTTDFQKSRRLGCCND